MAALNNVALASEWTLEITPAWNTVEGQRNEDVVR